jgi:hypothetical protein
MASPFVRGAYAPVGADQELAVVAYADEAPIVAPSAPPMLESSSLQYPVPVVAENDGWVPPQPRFEQTMERSTLTPLNWLGSTVVRQTNKGCLQTFVGCDANDEFVLANRANPDYPLLYAIEVY